jgi:hypothetical protein
MRVLATPSSLAARSKFAFTLASLSPAATEKLRLE